MTAAPLPAHQRDHPAGLTAARGPLPVITGEVKHTFPSRTRSLSPHPPMVVPPRCGARVGRCQYYEAFVSKEANASLFARIALNQANTSLLTLTLQQSDLSKNPLAATLRPTRVLTLQQN